MSENWPFADPENLAAFTLKRIVRGESPILGVTHDEDDGGWQFLDGSEVAVEGASLVSLREVTRLDASVFELADLPLGWVAWLANPEEPWQRAPTITQEDRERKLVSDIDEFGWHVALIPEDEEGPAFAYSVGLFKTLTHPEIIVFGLGYVVTHQMINLIGEGIRHGRRFVDAEGMPGIFEGYDVRFLKVDRRHYPEHFGYARWIHGGDDFPALQCLWPDRRGCFPTAPGFPEALCPRQPLLAP